MKFQLASIIIAALQLALLVEGDNAPATPGEVKDNELGKLLAYPDHHRDLKDRTECGERIMLINPKNLTLTSSPFLLYLESRGIGEARTIIDEILPNLEFAVEMIKVCASCKSENLQSLDPYCDPNAYGYDVTHSGNVFLPVNINEDASTTIIDAKELQTWASFRESARRVNDGVLMNTESSRILFNLLAASYGLVSMNFDMTGYGESASLVPSNLQKISVGTATLPIYFKVQSMIHKKSGGKTKLGKEISFTGYSEGGYNSIAAADAFQQAGMNPRAFAGGAPIMIGSKAMYGLLNTMDSPASMIRLGIVAALPALSLSSTRTDVANYMEDQDMLAGDRTRWLEMFTDPQVPSRDEGLVAYAEYISVKYADILALENFFSETLRDTFGNEEIENPCIPESVTDHNDKLCEALQDQDLTSIVLNANYDIDICHSENDELIAIGNIPAGVPITYSVQLGHVESRIPCLFKLFSGAKLEKPEMRKTKSGKSKSSKGSKGAKSAKSERV